MGHDSRTTRRRLLAQAGAAGLTAASAGGLVPLLRADSARAAPSAATPAWLHERVLELEAFGGRPSASPSHAAYNELVKEQLVAAGVMDVRDEPLAIDRWFLPAEDAMTRAAGGRNPWHANAEGSGVMLETLDASGATARRWKVANYVPYSGSTGPGGVEGRAVVISANVMSALPFDPTRATRNILERLAGAGGVRDKIVVFDASMLPLTLAISFATSWSRYDPDGELRRNEPYRRPWISQVVAPFNQLVMLTRLHAAGMVVVLADQPWDLARGSYYPYGSYYDGVDQLQDCPGVFLDRDEGRAFKAALQGTDHRVRLTLDARVERANLNVVTGTIPGATDRETIILNSHTDGPSAFEDNGPIAIVALARRFAAMRREQRPRTMHIAMTAHFRSELASKSFIAQHDHDWIERCVACLTLEHLGAKEWIVNPQTGVFEPTGKLEVGSMMLVESTPLRREVEAMLRHADLRRHFVQHRYIPDPESVRLDGSGRKLGISYTGEGVELARIGIPAMNYATGPTYLLSGTQTSDKHDYELFSRQVDAFAWLIDRCMTAPASALRSPLVRAQRRLHLRKL